VVKNGVKVPKYAPAHYVEGRVVREFMPRTHRHALLKEAKRAVKYLATLPAGKVRTLKPHRQDEWRFNRQARPTHNDGWLMRTLGFLFLWGDAESILGIE
jgi:hypothetical protein